MLRKSLAGALGLALAVTALGAVVTAPGADAIANTTVVTTPATATADGWYTEDGAPSYVATVPPIDGAAELQVSTPLATSKVNYLHNILATRTAGVSLSSLSGLAYSVKNSSGGPETAYDVEVLTTGSAGYTTFVYEPYENGHPLVANGNWNRYSDLEGGLWWSTHIAASAAGGQSTPEPLSFFESLYPNAQAITYGIGQGSNNGGSISYVDDVSFGATTTNFEISACTVTITGTHGAVAATSGTVCISNAVITGGISVAEGVTLDIENSTVAGGISAAAPAGVRICGSHVGSVVVSGATGPVVIGPADGCSANTVAGSVIVVGSRR